MHRGKLAGVVCESSIVRALIANPARRATIQSIVIRHAESVRLDADLATVQPLFRSCAQYGDSCCRCKWLCLRTADAKRCDPQSAQSQDRICGRRQESTSGQPNLTRLPPQSIRSAAFTPPKKRTIHALVKRCRSQKATSLVRISCEPMKLAEFSGRQRTVCSCGIAGGYCSSTPSSSMKNFMSSQTSFLAEGLRSRYDG